MLEQFAIFLCVCGWFYQTLLLHDVLKLLEDARDAIAARSPSCR